MVGEGKDLMVDMAMESIRKVLAGDDLEAKVRLYIDDVIRMRFSKPRLLTNIDVDSIIKSISEQREWELYGNYIRIEEALSYAYINISNIRLTTTADIFALRGYMYIKYVLQGAELLANNILVKIREDLRKELSASVLLSSEGILPFGDVEMDREGFIQVATSKRKKLTDNYEVDTSIDGMIKHVSGVLQRDFVYYKSIKQAFLDILNSDKQYTFLIYFDLVEQLDKQLEENPITASLKSYGETWYFGESDRVKSFYSKFKAFETLKDVEIDWGIYNEYKNQHLSRLI